MENEQCDFPKCKNPYSIKYIKKHICYMHWEQLCDLDNAAAQKILKKIGLIRNTHGNVEAIKEKG